MDIDAWHMARALERAIEGEGYVEPNPMVGCVVARGAEVIAEGGHRRFGGPHAEVEALAVAGSRAKDATLYVTLEPCCHHGKTPPCTDAVIAAGVRRVVVAQEDPFADVAGRGIARLRAAGIDVDVGVGRSEAEQLNAPYLKLVRTGRPWIIAKWAMTLDGKLATHTGASRWISNEASRRVVHALRGRMDAIIVGRRTVEVDDPLLTARPPGARTPMRIVLDSRARLPSGSQLLQTARDAPVLVAAGPDAPDANVRRLEAAGCEVWRGRQPDRAARLGELLDELGRRRLTNVLVEGGAEVLGSLFDARLLDEVHVFVAPRLSGGEGARSPIAGTGVAEMSAALDLAAPHVSILDGDVYVHGRIG